MQGKARVGNQEQLRASLQDRLVQATAAGDLSLLLDPEVTALAEQLTRLLDQDDAGNLPTRAVLGWFHWYRSQELADGQDQQDLSAAITMFVPFFLMGTDLVPEQLAPFVAEEAAGAVAALQQAALESNDLDRISVMVQLWQRILAATPADHPARPGHLYDLGIALRARFEFTGQLTDLNDAIRAGQEAAAISADHPDRGLFLFSLGVALQLRYQLTGQLTDLNDLIRVGREAAAATPVGHDAQAAIIDGVGVALRLRFERTGQPGDLDDAVQAGRDAVAATPEGHPRRAMYQYTLGLALWARFKRDGQPGDLDDTIQAWQDAMPATPEGHPDRPGRRFDLGGALQARFDRTGRLTDLDGAIQNIKDALAAIPEGHADRAVYLTSAGIALRLRFERTGRLADLDDAIQNIKEAVAATPEGSPDHAEYLTDLGIELQRRFRRTGQLADLDDAIKAGQEAVAATPEGHPDRAGRQSNLGVALQRRFERTGRLADLDDAIQNIKEAVAATPESDPDHPTVLFNLGGALMVRFQRSGVPADLDEAIQAGQGAVATTPAGHPDRAMHLFNLAAALAYRFESTGRFSDLDATIQAGQDMVATTPEGHPDRAAVLSNLGIAQRIRFERTGQPGDLDDAIRYLEEAVAATPAGHIDRATHLYNLGIAQRIRFERTGQPGDLDDAIRYLEEAVAAIPADHPDRARYLSGVGGALQRRFDRDGQSSDLNAAIQAVREAVDATPADDPYRARYLYNLGGALQARLADTHEDAIEAFAQAASSDLATPSLRIMAARLGAQLAAEPAPDQAAALLEAAIWLLPEVAPRELERSDQEHAVGGLAGLAADAAALVLRDASAYPDGRQRATRALQLLEAGRAVLLSQALDTRDDLTDLGRDHPDLAQRFTELRDRLDQRAHVLSIPLAGTAGDTGAAVAQLTAATEQRRRLVGQFHAVLAEIRKLDKFTAFGLPPATSELFSQAAAGPVVTFAVSKYGSHALLLTSAGIDALDLPALTADAVTDHVSAFNQALHEAVNQPDITGRRKARDTLHGILAWLWDTAAGPVLDALHLTQPPPAGADGLVWPRVWWAPGGLLGLLPIHAAGHHNDPARHTVLDRVVSSYTPTIRALGYARQHLGLRPAHHSRQDADRGSAAAARDRALIVAMPNTPGLPPGQELPGAQDEAAHLARELPGAVVLSEPDPTRPQPDPACIPTRANVLAWLPDCGTAHFICHGLSDPASPSQSRLLLHDHRDHPLTVADLARINLDSAQLAYLSACDTAVTLNQQLLDEAIHLTTAFQLAGYPHVIGTLWPIEDFVAADIARDFYACLRGQHGALDTSQAAHALHHAIRAQRDRDPNAPFLWAAYVHAGA